MRRYTAWKPNCNRRHLSALKLAFPPIIVLDLFIGQLMQPKNAAYRLSQRSMCMLYLPASPQVDVEIHACAPYMYPR